MKVFITGSAGFIGFHLAQQLLSQGDQVCGFDGLTEYYDVKLKNDRNAILQESPNYTFTKALLEDSRCVDAAVDAFEPEIIVHLAAQAGVRHSLQHPRAYIESNIVGSFNILEASRRHNVRHLLIASTSSVYGSNKKIPFVETDQADTQMSMYAATKKSTESMAHAYSHTWNLPVTTLRFFTVYGPYGRPDLALFKFVDSIIDGRPIDIYNHGSMHRDFTYVGDLAHAIRLLIDAAPDKPDAPVGCLPGDSLSSVAPFRVVNIGNSTQVKLLDFIKTIEEHLGKSAIRNYTGMQPGDVPATCADTSLLQAITGYRPTTDIYTGIPLFVKWFRAYYNK